MMKMLVSKLFALGGRFRGNEPPGKMHHVPRIIPQAPIMPQILKVTRSRFSTKP